MLTRYTDTAKSSTVNVLLNVFFTENTLSKDSSQHDNSADLGKTGINQWRRWTGATGHVFEGK